MVASVVADGELSMREWATRKLRYGDLTALGTLKKGTGTLPHDRLERLSKRGFIARNGAGKITVTIPGRIALLVRRLAPR